MITINWTPEILASIPAEVLKGEVQRRRAAARVNPGGKGTPWARHNPDTSRCRCKRCMRKREASR